MKFLRHTVGFSSLFIGVVFSILYVIFSYGPSDIVHWQKMQAKSQRVKNREYLAKQERQNVRKDVLLSSREGARLKMVLSGDTSQLLLDNRKGGEGLVENIENVLCLMQEAVTQDEKGNPLQIVRYFKADTAKYHNREGVFSAGDVEVVRYLVDGHEIPQDLDNAKPLMKGLAESVHLAIREKNVNFTAHQLHASLYKE